MGKRAKTHKTPIVNKPKKCLVHTWGYHDVDGLNLRFRVCERCDALEAKPKIPAPGAKWAMYAPTGGMEFVNAIRSQIARKSLANQNGIPLETANVEDISQSSGETMESFEKDK